MGQPIVTADALEVKIATYNNATFQLGLNVFHYGVRSITGTPLDSDVTDQALTLAETLYPPLMTAAGYVYGASCQIIGAVGPPKVPATKVSATFPTGGAGTTPLPNQVTGIVTWKTYYAGRKYRGRTYLPFPDKVNSDNTQQKPNSSYVTLLNAWGNGWKAGLSTVTGSGGSATLDFSVYALKPSVTFRAAIQGLIARDKWATQRRRGNYGRINDFPW